MNAAFFRKFCATFVIYWRDTFAYKAATLIWILADTQTALLMPTIWLAAFGQSQTIFGMTPGTLVTYYLCTLLLSQFIVCHLMWDIGFEIREGIFSAQLLRPFPFFWMTSARNISWRVLKLLMFLPFAVLFLLAYGNYLGSTPVYFSLQFFAAVVLGHLLSFVMAYSLSMTALWTTEFISVFQLYYFPEALLSGRLVPVGSLPDWARSLSLGLPFKYTVSFPAETLLGRVGASELRFNFVMQFAWIAFFLLLGRILLRKGTRQYTGFGN